MDKGTYMREPDGALSLYHSPQTCWNFPREGLRGFLANCSLYQEGSLWYWRQITNAEEIQALAHLGPGEYVVVE